MAKKSKERLRVFLCHSKRDKKFVRDLYGRLASIGCDPWLDERKLLPGQEWDTEIKKAVRAAHVVVICLSKDAITKRGYIQKEIRFALSVAEEVPAGELFIIPFKLEQCDPPPESPLCKYQWAEFADDGYNKLVDSLSIQAKKYRLAPLGTSTSNRQTTSINISTVAAVVNTFIDNYDHLTLPSIVKLLASDRVALVSALSPLIRSTESMDANEKQYWFDILSAMTEDQIGRLLEILGTERRQLIQLELRYQQEIRALNEKHLKEWSEFQKGNSAGESATE